MHGGVVQFFVCFADALISRGESGCCNPLIDKRHDHVCIAHTLRLNLARTFLENFDDLPYCLRHKCNFVHSQGRQNVGTYELHALDVFDF